MKRFWSGLLAALLLIVGIQPIRAEAATLPDMLVSNGVVRLQIGESENLTELMTYYRTDKEIYPVGLRSWKSSKPEVVSVEQNGVMTAHKAGTAKITLLYTDNHANMIEQTVRVRVSSGNTVPGPDYMVTVNEGQEINLKALLFPGTEGARERYGWIVNKDYNAAVTADGLLTAKSYGECKVTGSYTDQNGIITYKDVTIKVIQKHWTVQKEMTITMEPGETINLAAVLYPYYRGVSRYMSCSSSNSRAVSVEQGGVITAGSEGESQVTTGFTYNEEKHSQVIKVIVEG